MPRQEINYEKVAKAADKIKKKGKEPSVTDIYEALRLIGNQRDLYHSIC